MSEAWIKVDDARLASAADWLVRLQSPNVVEGELSDAEVAEFDGWLEAHPGNAAAYDRTLAVALELQDAASAVR
jgi:ferric-dicitrate binding protein FerR (iron transport regulator)